MNYIKASPVSKKMPVTNELRQEKGGRSSSRKRERNSGIESGMNAVVDGFIKLRRSLVMWHSE